jgi:Tol biopolymer transport system component
VLDRTTGRVTLESLTPEGQVLPGDSAYPRLSGDGRYLVFETALSVGDGTVMGTEIVLRDRVQNTTRRVSRGTSEGRVPESSRGPAISEDGRVVAFASGATDLVAGRDENGTKEDDYLFEVTTGLVRRISVDSQGVQRPDGASFAPSVSADGRYVAFTSTATLDGGEARSSSGRPVASVYVRDLRLGVTERVSVCPDGMLPDGGSSDPAISRDGRYVAFASEATNLVPGDRNRSADVFLRDLRTHSSVLISRSASGGAANGRSGNPAVSADGRFVAFQSQASDLICARRCPAAVEDINLLSDVFLFDRVNGAMIRISAGPDGWAEESAAPQVDAAGDVIAFISRHPIDERDINNDFDLFIRVH